MSIRSSIQARLDLAAHFTDGAGDLLPQMLAMLERESAAGLPHLAEFIDGVAAMPDEEFIEQCMRDLAVPCRVDEPYPPPLVELVLSAAANWRNLAAQTRPNANLIANADKLDALALLIQQRCAEIVAGGKSPG